MFTKDDAKKYVEWFKETLEEQSTAEPCIYFYNGKVDFSPGSQTGGTAQPVYNEDAEILVDKELWMDWYGHDVKTKTELLYDTVIDRLHQGG